MSGNTKTDGSRDEKRAIDPGMGLRKGRLLRNLLHEAATKMIQVACDGLLPEGNAQVLELLAGPVTAISRGQTPNILTGVGSWPDELSENSALNHRVCADVNVNPVLPFRDGCFDAAVLFFGVETLRYPSEVFGEVCRVLGPGAVFLLSYSPATDREYATTEWSVMDDQERLATVASYFEKTEGFGPVTAYGTKKRYRSDASKKRYPPKDNAAVWIAYARTLSRPSQGRIDWGRLNRTDDADAHPLQCPYCGEKLKKYAVPHSAFEIDYWYEADYLYICFNDSCPYFERGWEWMWSTMRRNVSYRHMYNPVTRRSGPIPVPTYYALRDGIVDDS